MEVIKKIYKAEIEELQDLLVCVEDFLTEHDATMKNVMNINIAVEEIFVNIASYAYEGLENKGAEINISLEDDVFSVEFVDWGIPFNPLAKVDPDVDAPIEERGIGGLGIYMVKKSMDMCTYERVEDKNVFTISKNIKQ